MPWHKPCRNFGSESTEFSTTTTTSDEEYISTRKKSNSDSTTLVFNYYYCIYFNWNIIDLNIINT